MLKLEAVLYLLILVLGLLIAVAPWTFAPVCASEMRCWFTRDVETIFGGIVVILSIFGVYKTLS